jgi:hypothetical protein
VGPHPDVRLLIHRLRLAPGSVAIVTKRRQDVLLQLPIHSAAAIAVMSYHHQLHHYHHHDRHGLGTCVLESVCPDDVGDQRTPALIYLEGDHLHIPLVTALTSWWQVPADHHRRIELHHPLVIPTRPLASRWHQDGFCLFLCYLIVSTSLGGPLGPRSRAPLARYSSSLVVRAPVATATLSSVTSHRYSPL